MVAPTCFGSVFVRMMGVVSDPVFANNGPVASKSRGVDTEILGVDVLLSTESSSLAIENGRFPLKEDVLILSRITLLLLTVFGAVDEDGFDVTAGLVVVAESSLNHTNTLLSFDAAEPSVL